MKGLLLLATLGIFSAQASYHSSCDQYMKGYQPVLKVTKDFHKENEMIVAVKLEANCSVGLTKSLVVYWRMGRERIGGKIPCEAPTNSEVTDILGFNSRKHLEDTLVNKVYNNQIEVYIPGLPKLAEKVGSSDQMSDLAHITITSEGGKCHADTVVEVSGRDYSIDRIHLDNHNIWITKLLAVLLYRNNQVVRRID